MSNIQKQGVCPICGNECLEYGSSGIEDTSYFYDWTCETCGASGKEWFDLVFSEHIVAETAMELVRGNVKVEFENIGEGVSGDYDENNPEDVNLLRFYISIKDGEGYDDWCAIDDASYCTNIPADTDGAILYRALNLIMDRVYDIIAADGSVKKICEELSWLSDTDFKEDK